MCRKRWLITRNCAVPAHVKVVESIKKVKIDITQFTPEQQLTVSQHLDTYIQGLDLLLLQQGTGGPRVVGSKRLRRRPFAFASRVVNSLSDSPSLAKR